MHKLNLQDLYNCYILAKIQFPFLRFTGIFFMVQTGFFTTLVYGNLALLDIVYDHSRNYNKGDAVIPSVSEFTLYTAKSTVPAGDNGPPNKSYWRTAEEYSRVLQDSLISTSAIPPSSVNIDISEISKLADPGFANLKSAESDCCESFQNAVLITKGMADSSAPYTKGGLTISGFIEGGKVYFDNLNYLKSVPGKIYPIADSQFTIVGIINTEFEILNRVIHYEDSNGDCWEVTLEDNTESEFSALKRVTPKHITKNIWTSLIYDPSRNYIEGDAVVPSVSEFTLYTAKSSVPAGDNGPPNTSYWLTAEEYSEVLHDGHSSKLSIPPSSESIKTSEISNLETPQNSNQKKTLTLIAKTGGSVSGAGGYNREESVVVTATPIDGYVFSNWSGDFSSADPSISVVMGEDYSLTASFAQDNRDDDGDSLTNYQEAVIYNTSTTNSDSDGDGINDGDEVNLGSNPAISDLALISYFKNQINSEKLNSYSLGYSDGKMSGQTEVIDEIVKVVASVGEANDLNISGQLKNYSFKEFLTTNGNLNLSNIQLEIEQFIDSSSRNTAPYTEGWFFTPKQGWMWTNKSVYPYFFIQNSGWVYYQRGYDLPIFYNFNDETWFGDKNSMISKK